MSTENSESKVASDGSTQTILRTVKSKRLMTPQQFDKLRLDLYEGKSLTTDSRSGYGAFQMDPIELYFGQ